MPLKRIDVEKRVFADVKAHYAGSRDPEIVSCSQAGETWLVTVRFLTPSRTGSAQKSAVYVFNRDGEITNYSVF